MQDAARDTKRALCRALTQVLSNSTLRVTIDPKSFFMMLSTNYPVLYRSGRFDLGPVWDALVAQSPSEELYGLFLGFQRAGASLGISVALPPAVAALSLEQQQSRLDRFYGTHDSAEVELSYDGLMSEADRRAPTLGTGDLKPFVPEDLRRTVIQGVTSAIKNSPIGSKLESAQLAYLVDQNFDDLCDGQTFQFQPILDGLRQLPGFKDADVLPGIVRLEAFLRDQRLVLQPLDLKIDPIEKARLLEDQAKVEKAAREAAAAPPLRIPNSNTGGGTPPRPLPAQEPPGQESARERRLRKWGLHRIQSRTWRIIRLSVLMAMLLGGLGFAWFTRPNRELDVDTFQGTVPLKQVALVDGTFSGVLDDARWWTLSIKERDARYKAFEQILQRKGWVPNAQVRDTQNRLVITTSGPRLKGAPFFLLGDRDGTIPLERRTPADPKKPPP